MQWNFFALSNNRSFSFASNCTLSADYFASVKHGFFCSIKKGISGHQLTIHLKELFPILDTVSIAHYPCGDIIRFKPHSPLFIVNQEWVLTENKQLFKKSFFASSAIEGIAQINISDKYLGASADVLCRLLSNIPTHCIDRYDWNYMSDNCIRLTDKNDNNFTVVYSSDRVISPLMLSQCEAVKNNIVKYEEINKSATWIVDIRFANYIVAYKA